MNEITYALAIFGAVSLFIFLFKGLGLKEIKLTFFDNEKNKEISKFSLQKIEENSRRNSLQK